MLSNLTLREEIERLETAVSSQSDQMSKSPGSPMKLVMQVDSQAESSEAAERTVEQETIAKQ